MISEALHDRIDQISRALPGFFIGRYDLRYSNDADLQRGENFKIIELNGAASEATNIYDERYSLFCAYRTLYQQWQLVYAIGRANRDLGHQPAPALKVLKDWNLYRTIAAAYPAADQTMCTLTVVTRDFGYYLAMNRDELISRGEAVPPTRVKLWDTSAIYPRDSAGGTWVAANNHGIAFALLNWNLNWNDAPQAAAQTARSRGGVIPELIRFGSLRDVKATLQRINLDGILSFRLVGLFPAEREIWEWRWNFETLDSRPLEWKPQHWFSSSLSDEPASVQRGKACQRARNEKDAGSLPWLHRLHASHVNGPGPFSVCVHRENVRTLSYTEIACSREKVECRYFCGSPCTLRELKCPVEMTRING